MRWQATGLLDITDGELTLHTSVWTLTSHVHASMLTLSSLRELFHWGITVAGLSHRHGRLLPLVPPQVLR
jgi:hypothetical protein